MAEMSSPDLIVLVDSGDNPIGAIPRTELPDHPGVHFRTSHVFLFNDAGQLLLQQLAPNRNRNQLHWGSSVAAYVRPGESYRDAAARRCEEELGLTAALELVGKTEMSDLGGVKHVSLFVARVGRSRPAIREPDHIARLSWTTLGEIARLITTDPDRFTETFLWLFEHFYADGQTRAAVGA